MSIKIKLKPLMGRDTSGDSRNVGSARELSGKVFVFSLFVSPPDNRWTSAEFADMKQRLLIAEQWLQQQASRYGKLVTFQNGFFGGDGKLVDPAIPHGAEDVRAYFYGQNLLQQIWGGKPKQFVDWVSQNTDCTQSLVIVFPHMNGRCFACPTTVPLNQSNPSLFTLETCTIYHRYDNSSHVSPPSDIAHEMLHLFGAWDLYELDERDANRAQTISSMYPNSIMINSDRNIDDLVIDEITAWLVGLKEVKKEWYRWFEPFKDEYEVG